MSAGTGWFDGELVAGSVAARSARVDQDLLVLGNAFAGSLLLERTLVAKGAASRELPTGRPHAAHRTAPCAALGWLDRWPTCLQCPADPALPAAPPPVRLPPHPPPGLQSWATRA